MSHTDAGIITIPETLRIELIRDGAGALHAIRAYKPDGALWADYQWEELDRILRMASDDPYSDRLPDALTLAEAIVLDVEG